ncbi:hypothetical protein J6590_043193 [Homalodisca vitripennis]|nr:hypothetical protein J6590_043193 [Homalodisca vitripennis]
MDGRSVSGSGLEKVSQDSVHEQAGLGDGWTFGKWKWAGESVTGQRAWYGIARFLFTSLPKRARLS